MKPLTLGTFVRPLAKSPSPHFLEFLLAHLKASDFRESVLKLLAIESLRIGNYLLFRQYAVEEDLETYYINAISSEKPLEQMAEVQQRFNLKAGTFFNENLSTIFLASASLMNVEAVTFFLTLESVQRLIFAPNFLLRIIEATTKTDVIRLLLDKGISVNKEAIKKAATVGNIDALNLLCQRSPSTLLPNLGNLSDERKAMFLSEIQLRPIGGFEEMKKAVKYGFKVSVKTELFKEYVRNGFVMFDTQVFLPLSLSLSLSLLFR